MRLSLGRRGLSRVLFEDFDKVLLGYRFGVIIVSLGNHCSVVRALFELLLGSSYVMIFFFAIIHVPLDRS